MAIARKKTFRKKIYIPLISLLLLALGFVYYFNSVQAFTSNNGVITYATTTSSGRIYGRTYTYPSTLGSQLSTARNSASAIQYMVNKAAPTRQENLIGHQKANGTLDIATCINGCSSTGSYTNKWSTSVIATNTVNQVFDIGYEQLSGRGMVVYANNATGWLYYCIWDGTSWGPVSNCAPDTSTHTNGIQLTDGTTSLSGLPRWVKLIPYGTQFGDKRSNQMLLAVEDANSDILVTKWDGSAWSTTDRLVVATDAGSTIAARPFDIGWESVSGTEMIVYARNTSPFNLVYRTSTGSGWGSESTVQALATPGGAWVRVGADSTSNRMSAIVTYGTSNPRTVHEYIWKTDGSTVGWTAGTNLTTAGQNTAEMINTAWLKSNSGTPKAIFVAANNGTGTSTYVSTSNSWTQAGGFVAWANMTGGSSDVINNEDLEASPNSDIMINATDDRDCRLRMRTYTGSAWTTSLLTTTIATTVTSTTSGCSTNTYHAQRAFQFAYKPYSAWSQNWRVYDDESATGNPASPLAAQDTQPTVKPNNIVRIRLAIAELSGGTGSGSRKKLQYSSGAGCPDSTSCTWTDVGAQAGGSIWRYANGGATDDALVSSTTLTGATAQGRVVENGTSASTDNPAGGSVSEYDFTIQNNGATIGTSYYFRAYDYGASVSAGSSVNLNAIFRQQILDTSGTEQTSCSNGITSVVCTYPTLLAYTSAPHPPTFYRPTNGNTNVSTTPIIQLKSSDDENDYIQYVVEWCPTNSWPCPSGGGIFDQTSSQTGWDGQDADSNLAYVGNFIEENSTMGIYTVNPGVFAPNTTYYLRAKSTDPGGSGIYGLYSSTVGFTTSRLEIRINGGTCIGGVGSSCTAGSGSFPIKIGN